MPAIQPHRLKIEVAELVDLYLAPEEFLKAYHDLLSFYADRTRRPGQSGQPPPLIQAYKVPSQVLKEIELTLKPKISSAPDEAFKLADVLWKEDWLEFRMLSIVILEYIPPKLFERVIDRVEEWAITCNEDRLLDMLLKVGVSQMGGENFDPFIKVVEGWFTSLDPHHIYVGLRAISSLLSFSTFDNLPVIFRLITPLMREAPSDLRSELVTVLQSLARRSPQETAYFMRQMVVVSNERKVGYMIRQSLPAFPSNIQDDLREELRHEMGLKGETE